MIKKIGVYVCHCGSNISDVIDVDRTLEALAGIEGVHILKQTMFACSDSAQKEIIEDIRKNELEGLVVASCSTKLHVPTFRNVARRAGLNPYLYVHVNIREQGSWAHSDQPGPATDKAIRMIRSAITRVQFARELDPIMIDAENTVAIVGAGIAGMRTALGLAALGTKVYLLERESFTGGKVLLWGRLTDSDRTGKEIADQLHDELERKKNVDILTGVEVAAVNGCVGDFTLNLNINDKQKQIHAGAVVLATGFDPYRPEQGEFGYGMHPSVVTLDELRIEMNKNGGNLSRNGRPVRQAAFIYCVGSCQVEGDNKYCSRICCTTTLDTALQLRKANPGIRCIHLYRQMRSYGKQELLYEEACRKGDLFLKFDDDDPPDVAIESRQISIKIRDLLTVGMELEIRPDLLVLVNGMVPSEGYQRVAEIFKAPVGRDRFFNEVHPKLRPVETVIDGIFLAGACQGPKNIAESVKSGMSAASKAHALLREEKIELDPTIAYIDPSRCEWCGLCAGVCPFDAIQKEQYNGKLIAVVIPASCKGCGMCNPVCPVDAIDLVGYTNQEIEGMIASIISAE